MKHHHIAIFDIDGTLFDPDIRLFAAPLYNHRTYRLLKKHKATIIVSTGRRKWIKFNDLQLHALGMYPPDHVVTGIGTAVLHKRYHYVFDEDKAWIEKMRKSGWDKDKILQDVNPILQQWNLIRVPTTNPFTLTFWLVNRSLADIERMRKEIEKLSRWNIKTVITEQLILPNTNERFSGYLFIIPTMCGKDASAAYLLDKVRERMPNTHFHIHVFGDALVDVPMLTMSYPNSTIHSHGLHLTPRAKHELRKQNAHHVTMHAGSAPATILQTLRMELAEADTLVSTQNSPYRVISRHFEPLLDKVMPAHLSPDDITQKGEQMVESGTKILYSPSFVLKRMLGYFQIIGGYFMDVFDGARARQHPQKRSKHGAIIDATSDRKKEFSQLSARAKYSLRARAAALSCLLPSIARAQAETIGVIVPEKDRHGGSSLSRVKNLIIIALLDLIGLHSIANRQQDRLYRANMATYLHRMTYVNTFASKNKKHNAGAQKRLETLKELLKKYASKKIENQTLPPDLSAIISVHTKKA